MEHEILLERKNEFMEENDRGTRKKREVKLDKYTKALMKMVVKARDMYVRSMHRLSDATAIGVGHVSILPRSFIAGNQAINVDKTMSELMRVGSARNVIITMTEQKSCGLREPTPVMMRNFSVGVARIDVDEVHELFPRSKSYGVTKSNAFQ